MAKSTPNKCSLASESKIGGAQLKYSVKSGSDNEILHHHSYTTFYSLFDFYLILLNFLHQYHSKIINLIRILVEMII